MQISDGEPGTGSLVNNATISLDASTAFLADTAVTGTGSIDLASSSTLALASASNSVTFEDSSASDLEFTSPAGYSSIIHGFGGDNLILVAGAAASQATYSDGTLALLDSSGDVLDDLHFAGSYSTSNFLVRDISGATEIIYLPTCYAAGTLIETEGGERPVESIGVGERLVTVDRSRRTLRAVIWAGRQSVDVTRAPEPRDARLVRIKAAALADGVPHRDLLVTSEHCLFLAGALIPARMLVNGRSIVIEEAVDRFEVYHLETEPHAIILANGVPSETYLDTGNRHHFTRRTPLLRPARSAPKKDWATHAAAPLATDHELVEPIWRGLDARADALGLPPAVRPGVTSDPGLSIVSASGARIWPIGREATRYRFRIPAGLGPLTLASRTMRPADVIGPYLDDRRSLGVCVGEIIVVGCTGSRRTSASHLIEPGLPGWHRPEGGAQRWTSGQASLPLGSAADRDPFFTLEFELRAAGPYIVADTGTASLTRLAA